MSTPIPNLSRLSVGNRDTQGPRQLVLVRAGSNEQCIFANASKLRAGEPIKLELASRRGVDQQSGFGIGKFHPDQRVSGPWRYVVACSRLSEESIYVIWEDFNFLMVLNNDLVFDVKDWNYKEGNAVNFVGGIPTAKTKTKKYGGGRDWLINEDGTIGLRHQPQFVLGLGNLAK